MGAYRLLRSSAPWNSLDVGSAIPDGCTVLDEAGRVARSSEHDAASGAQAAKLAATHVRITAAAAKS
jgi:hypothetical protein